MDAPRQQIAQRILKLLALAEGTSFAAEADTARRLADELMAKHNLDPATGVDGAKDRDRIEVAIHEVWAKGSRWEGIILGALADLASCTAFFNIKKLDDYALVGTTANLEVLRYLLAEINRQRIRAWLDYKTHGPDSFHKFCYGFAMALQAKVRQITDPGQIRANDQMLTLWYETNVLHKSVTTHDLATGAASSRAGLAAGAGASLHRGDITRSAPQRRLQGRP